MVSKITEDMDSGGEHNTSYNHRSTVIQRNWRRVRNLKIEGEWFSDPTILANHVSDHCNRLFDKVDQETETIEL